MFGRPLGALPQRLMAFMLLFLPVALAAQPLEVTGRAASSEDRGAVARRAGLDRGSPTARGAGPRRAGRGFRRISAWSRADGRFRISGLTFQAAYEIRARRVDFVEAQVQGHTPAPGQSAPPVRIVLGPGKSLAVVTPQGIVKALPFSFSAPAIRSDGAGGFETRLAAGTYKIKATREGFAPAEVQVEILPGRENTVEVRLTPR